MNSYEKIEELVIKAKAGDQVAFEELLKSFRNFINKQIRLIYVNGYEEEDLIQVGNIAIFKSVNSYDITKGNFTSYVTLAIKNNLNYLIRSSAKHRFNASLENFTEEELSKKSEALGEDLLEEEYLLKEEKVELLAAIEELKEKQKHLIYFLYIHDLGTMKNYAKIYGEKYDAVAKRKAVACKNIKEILKKRRRGQTNDKV